MRDLYRFSVWGPYRQALALLPDGQELQANRVLGRAVGTLASGARHRIERNLKRAFPHMQDTRSLALDAFATHFANQYLPFSFSRINNRNAERYLGIEGLEHLDRAIASGRGVLVMLPHMGPAQLPLHVLGLMGYPMHQVGGGEVLGLSPTGRWAAGVRASLEAHMPVEILDGKGYMRPILRRLAGGGVVMTTCDGTGGGRELGSRTVRTVCGKPMNLPLGPLYLALRGHAALLTLYTVHRPGKTGPRHVTRIGPELELERGPSLREAMELGAGHVADFLTRVLTRHPGDWHFWDHFEPGRFIPRDTST